ncbi:MAG: YlxR family protein [Chloroflexota bacterium]
MTGGPPPRRFPTRTCVACRTARQKRELLRVVRDPGGDVAVDPTGKAAGRGAYVCVDAACQLNAITRGALRRALDAPIPAGLFGPPPAPGAPTDDLVHDHEGGS